MANIYDRVVKEIIGPALRPLASILFGLDFKRTIEVKDKLHYTLEREGDHIKMLVFEDKRENLMLHLEFHVKDEDIGLNMLTKKAMLRSMYPYGVKQTVIFMGNEETLKFMKPYYKDEYTDHRFEIVELGTISYTRFLGTHLPEVATWAILADFEGKDPQVVFREILRNVEKFSKTEKELGQHIRRLEVLSKLRNLQPIFIQTINDMAFQYDLKTDIRYMEGKAEGIAEAQAKAKKEQLKRDTTSVTKMPLTGRFSVEEVAGYLDLSVSFVQKIKAKLDKEKKD